MSQPLFLDASTRVLIALSAVAGTAALIAAFAAVAYTYFTLQMKRFIGVQTLHAVFRMMEDTRKARTAVRNYLTECDSSTPKKPYLPIEDEKVRQSADDVCRIYDLLGLMDRHKLLDPNYTDEFYSVPLVILYDQVLGSYVEGLRRPGQRGPTHFWELTQFYERVKYTPINHPAYTPGATRWTKHRQPPDNPTRTTHEPVTDNTA